MMINYWDCEYSEAGEVPSSNTSEDPEWTWSYGCMHPDNPSWFCPLDNKWVNTQADCKYNSNDMSMRGMWPRQEEEE